MKLYSGPLSLFTAKVRIALDEKGLAYDRVEVGWSLRDRYLPHHPDVIALNPKREVPILVDGDVVVYDSTLIFEYLEDAYPETSLFPLDAVERARCRRFEAAADEILFPHVWALIDEIFYPSATGDGDAERVEGARTGLALYCDQLEKEFAGRVTLCDGFSVADIANFVLLNAAATIAGPVTSGRPQLAAWLERTAGRSAVGRELEAVNAFVQRTLGAGAPPERP